MRRSELKLFQEKTKMFYKNNFPKIVFLFYKHRNLDQKNQMFVKNLSLNSEHRAKIGILVKIEILGKKIGVLVKIGIFVKKNEFLSKNPESWGNFL